jgi:hypothetical protein
MRRPDRAIFLVRDDREREGWVYLRNASLIAGNCPIWLRFDENPFEEHER